MIYYILLVVLILLLRNQVFAIKDQIRRLKFESKCCYVIWFIIVLMAALRSPDVGADTLAYMADYEYLHAMSFADIASRHTGYLGYFYTSKLFSLAGFPLQVWFGFVEALYAFAMILFINKYSEDKLFSILVFVTIGLFAFSFAGLKQVMSMSLMMLAFLQFVEKRYIFTVILIIAAYFCHPAGLIFLAAFVWYYIRGKKYSIYITILSIVLIYIYNQWFMQSMVEALNEEHFEMYITEKSEYSYVTFIFYLSITIMSFVGYRGYVHSRPDDARLSLLFSFFACGLQLLAGISAEMFRLAYLYSPFMMILLPNSCRYTNPNTRSVLQVIMIGSIIFYFFYTGRNDGYSFFW